MSDDEWRLHVRYALACRIATNQAPSCQENFNHSVAWLVATRQAKAYRTLVVNRFLEFYVKRTVVRLDPGGNRNVAVVSRNPQCELTLLIID